MGKVSIIELSDLSHWSFTIFHICPNKLAHCVHKHLTLNVPIATKFVSFSRLLKCLRSLYGKQCEPRSDCSYRSSLFWVHAVCFSTQLLSNARQLFAAVDFSRWHFQIHFFLGALRVKRTVRPISLKLHNISYCPNKLAHCAHKHLRQ